MSKKIVLYGAGEEGEKLLRRMEELQDAIEVLGYADSFKTGYYCGYPILSREKMEEIEADIVITVKDHIIMKQIYDNLAWFKKGNIYWHYDDRGALHTVTYDVFLLKECIRLKDCVREKGILPRVEMHICDYCNLNCSGCTHFSPIFERKLPDRKKRIADVQKLSEKVGVVLKFFIMGGEPFLNPDIARYIEDIRKILPDTDLWVVTNGLLIPGIEEEVLACMQRNNVAVSISEYEPTHYVIDKIKVRLENAGLHYNIRSYDIKQKFIKPLSLSDRSKYNQRCISEGCINICDGMIARCPTLMYIDRFNETFGTMLPNDGIYDLDDCPSGEELMTLLQQEVSLCRHCVENETEWSRCGSKVVLSDFAVRD